MPQVITNGDFSAGATGWTIYSGCNVSGGQLNCTTAGQMCGQNPGLITGQTYTFSFDVNASAGAKIRINNSSVNGANVVWTSATLVNGFQTLSGSFIANGTFVTIEADSAAFSGTVDNVSVIGALPTANVRAGQFAVIGVEQAPAANVRIGQLAVIALLEGPPAWVSMGPAFNLPCWQPCTAFGTEAIVIRFK